MASLGEEGCGVSEQKIDYEFKVELIGDFELGKSEILVQRKVTESGTTVIVECETKTIHIKEKSVKAYIWGIVGPKRTNVDSNASYKDADGLILVYDITNHQSYDRIIHLLEELRRNAKEGQVIILIGNKKDSGNDRKVPKEVANAFAEANKLLYEEISALEGTNFGNALTKLLEKLVTKNLSAACLASNNNNIISPTINPTFNNNPTNNPTFNNNPTINPTINPTFNPTISPTISPTINPNFQQQSNR